MDSTICTPNGLFFKTKHRVLFSFLISSCLFLIATLIVDFKFQSFDEACMLAASTGDFYFEYPTVFNLYSHFSVGAGLKILYSISSNIPWYVIFLSAPFFIFNLLIYSIYLKLNGWKNLEFIFVFALSQISVLLFIQNLQFTIAAGLYTVCGIIILSKRNGWKSFSIGLLLILIGASVRFQSGLLTFVLFSPFLVQWKTLFNINSFRKEIIWLSSVAILVIPLLFTWNYINIMAYNQYGGDFYKYQNERGSIIDNTLLTRLSAENQTKALNTIDWSKNDFDLFTTWLVDNHKKFSLENIRKFRNYIEDIAPRYYYTKIKWYKEMLFQTVEGNLFLCSLISIIFIFGFSLRRDKIYSLVVSLLIFIAVCTVIFTARKIFPSRVYLPYLLSWPFLLISQFDECNRKIKKIVSGLLVICATSIIVPQIIEKEHSYQRDKVFFNQFANYLQLNNENLFIDWGGGIDFKSMDPLRNTEQIKGIDFAHASIGNVPSVTKNINSLGISSLYESIISNDKIRLIIQKERLATYPTILKSYVLNNYDKSIELDVEKCIGSTCILKVRPLQVKIK